MVLRGGAGGGARLLLLTLAMTLATIATTEARDPYWSVASRPPQLMYQRAVVVQSMRNSSNNNSNDQLNNDLVDAFMVLVGGRPTSEAVNVMDLHSGDWRAVPLEVVDAETREPNMPSINPVGDLEYPDEEKDGFILYRDGHTVTLIDEQRMLMVGGTDDQEHYASSLVIIDASAWSASWIHNVTLITSTGAHEFYYSQTSPLLEQLLHRRRHCAVRLPAGDPPWLPNLARQLQPYDPISVVLVYGGTRGAGQDLGDAFLIRVFDRVRAQIVPVSWPLVSPVARSAMVCEMLSSTSMFIFGGLHIDLIDGGREERVTGLNDTWILDLNRTTGPEWASIDVSDPSYPFLQRGCLYGAASATFDRQRSCAQPSVISNLPPPDNPTAIICNDSMSQGAEARGDTERLIMIAGGCCVGDVDGIGQGGVIYFNSTSMRFEEAFTIGDRGPSRCYASSVVFGHKLVVFGGQGSNPDTMKSLNPLDMSRAAWLWTDFNLPQRSGRPRAGLAGVRVGTTMLVHGGVTNTLAESTASDLMFKMDLTSRFPDTQVSTQLPRMFHTATAIGDFPLFVMFGGQDNHELRNDLVAFTFDLRAHTWMPQNSSVDPYSVIPNGVQPAPRLWTSLAFAPTGGLSVRDGVLGSGSLFLFGGACSRNNSVVTDIRQYVPMNDLWSFSLRVIDNVTFDVLVNNQVFAAQWQRHVVHGGPGARWGHTLTLAFGSTLVLYGGRTATDEFADCWLFDVSLGTWRYVDVAGSGPGPMAGHVAVVDQTKYLISYAPSLCVFCLRNLCMTPQICVCCSSQPTHQHYEIAFKPPTACHACNPTTNNPPVQSIIFYITTSHMLVFFGGEHFGVALSSVFLLNLQGRSVTGGLSLQWYSYQGYFSGDGGTIPRALCAAALLGDKLFVVGGKSNNRNSGRWVDLLFMGLHHGLVDSRHGTDSACLVNSWVPCQTLHAATRKCDGLALTQNTRTNMPISLALVNDFTPSLPVVVSCPLRIFPRDAFVKRKVNCGVATAGFAERHPNRGTLPCIIVPDVGGQVVLESLVIHGASLGSGIGLLRNADLLLRACMLNDNAAVNGAAVQMHTSRLTVDGSAFYNNRAVNGGAISGISSTITIQDEWTLFIINQASLSGGAIFCQLCRIDIVGRFSFINNGAYMAGGALSIQLGTLNIDPGVAPAGNSVFLGNRANGTGGAVFADERASVFVSAVEFTDNVAQLDGGAIAIQLRSYVTLTGTDIHDNKAVGNGGAIAIDAKSGFKATNSTMSHNTAGGGGGAVYSISLGSVIFDHDGLTLTANSALYGDNLASSPASLGFLEHIGNLTVPSKAPWPKVHVGLFDQYGHLVLTDNETVVSVRIFEQSINASISGTSIARAAGGVVTFDGLILIARPLQTLHMLFQSGAMSLKLRVSVRECADGFETEQLGCEVTIVHKTLYCDVHSAGRFANNRTNGLCVGCPAGRFAATPGAAVCDACPPETYQLNEGQTECRSCPEAEYLQPPDSCHACPRGVQCPKHSSPFVLSGFYAVRDDAGEIRVTRCLDERMCVAGVSCDHYRVPESFTAGVRNCCGPNRQPAEINPLCGRCETGYYQWGSTCSKCTVVKTSLYLTGFFCFSWIYMAIFFRLSQATSALTTMLFYFLQLVGLLIGNNNLLAIVISFFNFRSPNSSNCIAPISDIQRLLLGIYIPIACTIELLVMGCVVFLRRQPFHLSPWIRAMCGMLLFTYNSVAETTLSFFNCKEVSRGVSVVFTAPGVWCHSAVWNSTRPLMVVLLVFVVVLAPCVMLFLLIRAHNRGALRQLQTIRRYGIVYEVYADDRFWWSFFVLCRRSIAVALSVFLAQDRNTMFLALAAFNLMVLLMNVTMHPYRLADDNVTDTYLHSCLVLLALLMASTESSSDLTTGQLILAVLLIYVPTLSLVFKYIRLKIATLRRTKIAEEVLLSNIVHTNDNQQPLLDPVDPYASAYMDLPDADE